jgi:hypothetical protein
VEWNNQSQKASEIQAQRNQKAAQQFQEHSQNAKKHSQNAKNAPSMWEITKLKMAKNNVI